MFLLLMGCLPFRQAIFAGCFLRASVPSCPPSASAAIQPKPSCRVRYLLRSSREVQHLHFIYLHTCPRLVSPDFCCRKAVSSADTNFRLIQFAFESSTVLGRSATEWLLFIFTILCLPWFLERVRNMPVCSQRHGSDRVTPAWSGASCLVPMLIVRECKVLLTGLRWVWSCVSASGWPSP